MSGGGPTRTDVPRPPADADGEQEAPRFGEAMAEIEAILQRIEGEQIDIDDLAEELRRASHLLEVARAKIRHAEVEVTQIVQNLEAERSSPAEEEDAGGDGGEPPGGDEQDDIPF